ncbi:MAG: hypothetical protein E7411_06805 [Ruminococcaceae bacterium]|nr:hypothetical protein [Oscillospiraceae bacterium]
MKRIISIFTVLAILILSMSAMTVSVFAEGTGTEDDPYIVTDAAGFLAMQSGALGTWYELGADVDLGENYTPFVFKGNLKGGTKADGSKYTVTYSVSETNRYAGLFTQMYGKVSNLSVKSTATDARLVGAIAGELLENAQIDNCVCEVDLTTTESIVGGIAGQMRQGAVVKNCVVSGTIHGTLGYVGGIIGQATTGGTIENCVVTTNTTITSGGKHVGGIIGSASAAVTVTNCKNGANITSTISHLGGIVGYAVGITVSKCVNTGRIEGTTYVSGIAADLRGNCTIENCLNAGEVVSPVASGLSAGIIASATNTTDVARYCINSGVITGKQLYRMPVGTYSNKGTMIDCYYVTPETAFTALYSGETEISDVDWYTMITNNTLPTGISSLVWEYVPVSENNSYALPQLIGNNCNDVVYTIDVEVDTVNYGGGNGSIDLPYIINNATHLANISLNPSAYFKLNSDITVTTPVADFAGDFNGNNKTVTLAIETSANNVGMFATITGDAKIYDLTLTGSVTGGTNVGSVAGIASGTTTNSKIENVINNADVSGSSNVGGIIGHVNTSSPAGKTTVENCHNYGVLSSTLGAAGGIVALSNGPVIKCSNNADVTGYTQVGGISGFAYSYISKSYNTGKITATRTGHSNTLCGGIAGGVRSANAYIDICYNTGSVVSDCANGIASGSTHASGAIVITNSFNLGAVVRADGTQPVYTKLSDAWTTSITNVYYLTKEAYDDSDVNTTNINNISNATNLNITGYTNGGAYPVITDNKQSTLNTFIALTFETTENGTVKFSDMAVKNYYIKAGETHTLIVSPEYGYMSDVTVNDNALLEDSITTESLALSPFVTDTDIVVAFNERPATDAAELQITTPISVFVPETVTEGNEYTIKNQDGDFTVEAGKVYGATFSKISGYFGWDIVEFGVYANDEKYPSELELTDKGSYGIVFEGLTENITVKPYVIYQNTKVPEVVITVYGTEATLEVE